MEVDPIRGPATLARVAVAISQLHECVEAGQKQVAELRSVVEGVKSDIDDIKAAPMKAARWIGGTIAAAAVGVMVQNFILHEETTRHTDRVAEQTAAVAQATDVKVAKVAQAIGVPPP